MRRPLRVAGPAAHRLDQRCTLLPNVTRALASPASPKNSAFIGFLLSRALRRPTGQSGSSLHRVSDDSERLRIKDQTWIAACVVYISQKVAYARAAADARDRPG